MIHGTNETALSSICQTGFIFFWFIHNSPTKQIKKGLVITGETDAGYYGQGIIFSLPISLT